ncbi:alpha/beta fold hydrolase [Amycolatopsis sp. H20-H5]|uniref:alpha/beta fold hydrolase n=1 Tax=Amycolatopsis sp. H20-H5 TaxID=3046309 RepID=UPI002DBE399B|nr:alpha/beta hydrolase [Amycolatopsis sp. H20-H5]MEC3976792.1 alpha/beta hydrolase [Amycolatopsis sp. H20-H5]
MTTTTTTQILRVPGAHLHYDVSGTGPVVLLIPGGAMDAGPFSSITGPLSEHYTVVTYDPRGISRSELDDPAEEQHVSVHADDAHLLLAELGAEPAYVVGSSGGAITGLSLVERHPGQVRTLLAHEPPLTCLLPDSEEQERSGQEVQDVYRREGTGAAMVAFMKMAGFDGGAPGQAHEPTPQEQAGMARMQGNFGFFFGSLWSAITGYRPDLAKLRDTGTRVVPVGGEQSHGQVAYLGAAALAERLGLELEAFPGDHGGLWADPATSVPRLLDLLRDH